MSLDPRSTGTSTAIDSAPSRSTGTNFAITLLAFSIAIFFAAQIGAAGKQSGVMSWQMDNGKKQIENAKANEEQLGKLIEQQKQVVDQVEAMQKEYQTIFEELLTLADDGDADAKTIVQHWKIARNKPAEKPPTP